MIAAKKLKKGTWRVETIVLSACCLLFWPPATAQTNAPRRTISSSRYLLIVETSHAMQKRAENTLKVASDLVRSGLNGQMHDGDTLGLWTYNEQVYTGKFPLAKWSPQLGNSVAAQVGKFLNQQKFEKQSDFRPVM